MSKEPFNIVEFKSSWMKKNAGIKWCVCFKFNDFLLDKALYVSLWSLLINWMRPCYIKVLNNYYFLNLLNSSVHRPSKKWCRWNLSTSEKWLTLLQNVFIWTVGQWLAYVQWYRNQTKYILTSKATFCYFELFLWAFISANIDIHD